jgi:insulysin
MGAMQDRRRLWYVEQDVMRRTHHPFSHFGCGNLTTLSSLDQNSVREWFNKEYDPRGMHLVVYSHEPLEVLERRVKERFGKIRFNAQWKGPVRSESYGEIIPSTVYGSQIFVEPIKDIQHLRMIWQVPPRFGSEGNRAGVVAARVLGRSPFGSAFLKLKSEGLAHTFSAEVENESADSSFFIINVELTSYGLLSLQRVQEIVYQAIGTMGRIPLPSYVVEQHNTMSTLNYQWQTRRTDYQLFAETVYALRQENLSSFPQKSLFWEHSPTDVADLFLNHLLPNKSIVFIQAKSSNLLNVTFNLADPIVGVRYSVSKIPDKELTRFNIAHESLQPDISYMPKSEYMPDPNIQVLQPQDPSTANLSRWEPNPVPLPPVDSNNNVFETSWLASDVEFGTPKIVLKTSIFSPALDVAGDSHKTIIVYLWRRQVLDNLGTLQAGAGAGGYRYIYLSHD